MKRQQAIAEIRSRWKELYPADNKSKGIICPICGSGSGPKGTGITGDMNHGKPDSLKCWACGFSGDVIDLIQQDKHVDFNEAVKTAAAELCITIDAPQNATEAARIDFSSAADKVSAAADTSPRNGTEDGTSGIANYVEYYRRCAQNIHAPAAASYLSARGISLETARANLIGYDEHWKSPTVLKNQRAKGSSWTPEATARIIMPVSKNHYIARAISSDVKEFAKMNETGGGSAGIFNGWKIYGCGTVFVTEGIFDALSIIEVGAMAIALNSTSNADLLIKQLETKSTDAEFIICLDNDEAGQKATAILKDGFNRLNISYTTANICGQYKDPNEALTGNRKAFKAAVKAAAAQLDTKPDNTRSYIDKLMQDDIEKLKSAADRKTNFSELDRLSGGLYPGLYVLAATSSLGKTTFSLQIADNLAAAGHDVLFFSMEQSRLELVSKSLARMMAQKDREKAISSLAIRKGSRTAALTDAIIAYKEQIADRLSIIEGNFDCNISFIGEYIRRYIKRNNCRPIVFIDYLQILQPAEEHKRASTKEMVDSTVTELKRLSREFDITVFIISSVNRANYLTPIDFESLKESGGIEYTADVIWGLQLQCLNEPLFSEANKIKEKRQRIRQEKAADPRQIELLCLKNRYGVANFSCGFDYYPANDLFIQTVAGEFNPYYGANPFEDTAPKKDANRI